MSNEISLNNNKQIVYTNYTYIIIVTLTSIIFPIFYKYITVLFPSNQSSVALLMSTVAQVIGIGIPSFLLTRVFKSLNYNSKEYSFRNLLFENKINLSQLVSIVIIAISFFFSITLFMDGLKLIYIASTDDFSITQEPQKTGIISFLVLSVFFAFIPAIFEEIYYRMVFFWSYQYKKKSTLILISAVLFMLAHRDYLVFIPTFTLGIILMLVLFETKSIVATIIIHIIYNMLTLFYDYVIWLPSKTIVFIQQGMAKDDFILYGLQYMGISVLIFCGVIVGFISLKNGSVKKLSRKSDDFWEASTDFKKSRSLNSKEIFSQIIAIIFSLIAIYISSLLKG